MTTAEAPTEIVIGPSDLDQAQRALDALLYETQRRRFVEGHTWNPSITVVVDEPTELLLEPGPRSALIRIGLDIVQDVNLRLVLRFPPSEFAARNPEQPHLRLAGLHGDLRDAVVQGRVELDPPYPIKVRPS